MNTGKAIIDGIISGRLMHATCVQDKAHTCLVVWSGSAAEQLEAIVGRPQIEVEWQHEETGNRITRYLSEGQAIPEFKRYHIIRWKFV